MAALQVSGKNAAQRTKIAARPLNSNKQEKRFT